MTSACLACLNGVLLEMIVGGLSLSLWGLCVVSGSHCLQCIRSFARSVIISEISHHR